MWVCLNDCFLSIVHKDCARDELLVRARRRGDIEKIFPRAMVRSDATADYLFRAAVRRTEVEEALVGEVRRITYDNFKASVRDMPLHDAYLRVWTEMLALQPFASSLRSPPSTPLFREVALRGVAREVAPRVAKKKRRRKRRSLKKGR